MMNKLDAAVLLRKLLKGKRMSPLGEALKTAIAALEETYEFIEEKEEV